MKRKQSMDMLLFSKNGKFILGTEPTSNGVLTEKELYKHIKVIKELDKITIKPRRWWQVWRRK